MPKWHGQDLTRNILSPASIQFLSAHHHDIRRPFNTNSLGGSLTFHLYPEVKIFMDDRADLFKDDFVFNAYLPVAQTRSDWPQILSELKVDSLILKQGDGLVTAARQQGEWKQVHADDLNVIFLKQRQKPVKPGE
jgi:hypothetical protein